VDNENQSEKKLSAPEVDHMIYQAEHMPDISDDRTKLQVLMLFQKMQSIKTYGDDELRELWLIAPRGSIEKFGDYESYLEDGEMVHCRHDIGTEELAHFEMVGSMVYQLIKDATIEEIKKEGFAPYFADHDRAVFPSTGTGVPFTAAYIQSKGDPVADLHDDLAAEQKARATYERLIDLADDPDVIEPLKFLRQREIVHFQRFGEALRKVQEYIDSKKYY